MSNILVSEISAFPKYKQVGMIILSFSIQVDIYR